MPINILAIETSCDETSAAVVRDGRVVLSNIIFSQVKQHEVFGGVVPEIASRKHVEVIIPIIDLALSEAAPFLCGTTSKAAPTATVADSSATLAAQTATTTAHAMPPAPAASAASAAHAIPAALAAPAAYAVPAAPALYDSTELLRNARPCVPGGSSPQIALNSIDAVAVTYGPGLAGALLTGLAAAKGLAFSLGKPLIGVNHIEGHICAAYLEYPELAPPFTALVVSGGHSHIYYVPGYREYELMGRTRDDAAGEAFDKIARAGGLGYPGGPKLSRAAADGDPEAFSFPRVRFGSGSYDFSFSGPKTAALNQLNKLKNIYSDNIPGNIMASFFSSFQAAVVDILVENVTQAELTKNTGKIVVVGGVAANTLLREKLTQSGINNRISIFCPPPALCTDNAAMIGSAAYFKYSSRQLSSMELNAIPGASLDCSG